MRIEVLKILDPAQGLVFFSSDFGSASGRWMEPGVGTREFDVELDLPVVEEWAAAAGEPALVGAEAGFDVWIRCQVERVHGGVDTCVVVRTGPNLTFVEIVHRRAELVEGGLISFRVPEIRLYPYTL
ncbi:hypothetical protein UK23_13215 [Lentzea aerocolonigenes]|uniref:Uncharacterized protein n=1 Tax=Lentzea aerocolonigenes TaxID=68170 RepID=A0A0F0H5V7_LENAE|nr:hypothetical protein [Lentzea aerocolonigenes]KJK49697.1 hypothetical protein UK23_13215 [Lentzea aerocolonigenes]